MLAQRLRRRASIKPALAERSLVWSRSDTHHITVLCIVMNRNRSVCIVQQIVIIYTIITTAVHVYIVY